LSNKVYFQICKFYPFGIILFLKLSLLTNSNKKNYKLLPFKFTSLLYLCYIFIKHLEFKVGGLYPFPSLPKLGVGRSCIDCLSLLGQIFKSNPYW